MSLIMDFQEKKEYLKEISRIRKSNVICYISGDRNNVSTRIAPDIIPIFHEHLERIGNSDKIDLVLFSKGGDVLTALRLVQLLYEYTNNFSVLIPFKSYSAGTLVALGASEIVMTKMAELSPIDPNVTSVFNPQDPNNPSAKIPISVEDVYSFITVAKEIIPVRSEECLTRVFSHLIDSVHPLAIGTIHRTYSLIRSVAKKLLLLHMDENEEEKINKIIDNLTQQLFSHSYMITRREAKEDIKLPVTFSSGELESIIWNLYKSYESELLLEKTFIPEENADMNGRFAVCCGIIDSLSRTDGYTFEGVIQRHHDPGVANNINILHQGWKKLWEERK